MVVRALPATWTMPRLSWRRIGWAVYIGVNIGLALRYTPELPYPKDWALWLSIPERLATGTLYSETYPFVWSPLMAPVMASVATIGYWPWAMLIVGSVFLLRSPLLILLVFSSWGFWADLSGANTFTLVFVAGALALRGSRWAVIASWVLILLMPRPVQVPLVVWLVWQHRDLWRWFVGIFIAHALAVLATGLAFEWIGAMLTYGQAPGFDIGPTRWLGLGWLIAGIPLAAFLAWKGRLGWAGLAMTPYLLPQYLLVALWEMRDDRR